MSSVMFARISGTGMQRWDDDDWNEYFKRTRYAWERYPSWTESPENYNDSLMDNATLKMAIFIPIGVGLLLFIFLRIFLCNDGKGCCGDSSTTTSSRTLHAPPRLSSTPRFSTANLNTRRFHTPSMTGSREGLLRSEPSTLVTPTIRSSVSNDSTTTNNAVESFLDKPPDYSLFVISDSSKKDKFPEVIPALNPDSPPPKYDEISLPKY